MQPGARRLRLPHGELLVYALRSVCGVCLGCGRRLVLTYRKTGTARADAFRFGERESWRTLRRARGVAVGCGRSRTLRWNMSPSQIYKLFGLWYSERDDGSASEGGRPPKPRALGWSNGAGTGRTRAVAACPGFIAYGELGTVGVAGGDTTGQWLRKRAASRVGAKAGS